MFYYHHRFIEMNFWCVLLVLFCGIAVQVNASVKVLDDDDPGQCDKSNHAEEVLVKDRENNERILICSKNDGVYQWKATDGSSSPGEIFNPGYDCSDILDKDIKAKDGFYWIQFDGYTPKKVWCDMTTDGGGFMLVGRKNNSITWTVPSNDYPVEPFGFPHWSSALGDAPIFDFRVQVATSEDFKETKAHWSFRLQSKRQLKNLMVRNQGGCSQQSAGIGNIAYVKDLQTEDIVTTNFRCSKFGYSHHPLTAFGWSMMNSCLQKPCPLGFAFHHKYPIQTDYSGAFSYSVTGNVSGINYDATAFVGCDNKHCCGCYGPVGGTKDYCTKDCQPLNGGTITTNVFTWFWVRSTLPKRVWNKCMEYKVVKDNGNIVWYKLLGDSAVPTEGRCSKNNAILHDGVVVVPDASTAKKIPFVAGLLAYRKDNKELYIRANKTWNVIAQENEVLQKTVKIVEPSLKKIEKNLENQSKDVSSLNLKLSELERQIKYIENNSVIHLPDHQECSSYAWFKDANRNEKYTSGTDLCDSGLTTGWYRFGGQAGIKMPTSCVPKLRCRTQVTGWMNGAHPTVSDGKVTRKVCFNWVNNCCYWSNNIEVLNCGYFFIYKLGPPPGCNFRYCGSDN